MNGLGGAYTLSLSGGAGFRVWTTTPAVGEPLLVCGQTVTNGVGVTFLSGDDTDLFVEAVSNGTATLTYAFAGSNVSCSASLRMTAFEVGFVEDGGTLYNFSPSLGETNVMKVAVFPEPPETGIPGHHLKIEIVRETQGGADQHIDWVDVNGENTFGRSRGVDFDEMTFRWDGVPVAPFGSAAAQADGRDMFTGVSASVNRLLPAVTLGQPVPPPFVTAVAKIVRDSDGTVVAAARKRIFVPQVVRITYDADAVTMTKAGKVINNTNGVPVYLISPMSDTEWATQKGRIRAIAQTYYDATGANVRFVDEDVTASQPFSTMRMTAEFTANYAYGATLADFLNANACDGGELFCNSFQVQAVWYYDAHPTMTIPITTREVGIFWAHVITHECGHMCGLVAPGDVLDGSLEGTEDDVGGWHNKNPFGKRVMNPGQSSTLEGKLNREGDWYWKSLNANYLKFVLPKNE